MSFFNILAVLLFKGTYASLLLLSMRLGYTVHNCAGLQLLLEQAFLSFPPNVLDFLDEPLPVSKSRITNQTLGTGCFFSTSVCKVCNIVQVCSVPCISIPWQIQHLCETHSIEILLQSRTVYYTGIVCSIKTMCCLYFAQFSFYAKFYFKGNLWLTQGCQMSLILRTSLILKHCP